MQRKWYFSTYSIMWNITLQLQSMAYNRCRTKYISFSLKHHAPGDQAWFLHHCNWWIVFVQWLTLITDHGNYIYVILKLVCIHHNRMLIHQYHEWVSLHGYCYKRCSQCTIGKIKWCVHNSTLVDILWSICKILLYLLPGRHNKIIPSPREWIYEALS